MVRLTGKWSIKASFGKVPVRRRIPQRLHIQGSVAHDGFHPLREGTALRPVAGSACIVTPQWFEAKSGIWYNADEVSEMGFEAGEGIVINSYSNPTPAGPATPIAPSAGGNTLSLRCISLDRVLKTPRSKGGPPSLAIPLYFMDSVPVCCRPKDGGSRKINVGTGHARWVDGAHALASVVTPNDAWAVRSTARWIKYAVEPPLPSSDEDGIIEPEYFYALKLFVPSDCRVPITVQLNGMAYGDNAVVIALDGVELGRTPTGTAYGFRDPYGVPFSAAIAPGHHVLTAKVHNISGPTGLLVEAILTVS